MRYKDFQKSMFEEGLTAYDEKNDYLRKYFKELSPLDFYQEIFPEEFLERKGDRSWRSSNPIFSYRITEDVRDEGGKVKKRAYFRNQIVFADCFEESVGKIYKNDFALCALCTYVGRHRSAKNAFRLYGFIIDLDGVSLKELEALFGHVNYVYDIPCPSYVVNSGSGLHLYYVFENPVPLYPKVVRHLQNLKKGLTEVVWQKETSQISVKERQYQGIYQTFRAVGSRTKLAQAEYIKQEDKDHYLVKAFRTGNQVTLTQLNRYVDGEYQVPENPDYSSWEYLDENHHTLEECKILYPEWYQKRIIEGREPEQWVCNTALYDWWLRKIQEGKNARDGNRYYCISMLYVYAIKCDIMKADVDADAYALVEPFNALTVRDDNQFTDKDVYAASKFYDKKFVKMSREGIARRTGIEIPANKRNGRKQKDHVKVMNTMKTLKKQLGEEVNEGRPSKEAEVKEWRRRHPDGSKTACKVDTGLSYPTIRKWW